MQKLKSFNLSSFGFSRKSVKAGFFIASLVGLLLIATPAFAHHPSGGSTPSNAFEGFLSGLGHPVVGFDHLIFVVASGLIAAVVAQGFWVPIAFVLASMVGTVVHVMELSLPMPEVIISASVLVFGGMLAMNQKPNLAVVAGLGAIAGLFHGYAYGEAVVGADMSPLIAYLAGFTVIQLAIALSAFAVGRKVYKQKSLALRFAGFTILGFGAAFLSSAILG